jgi:hypothetical protein
MFVSEEKYVLSIGGVSWIVAGLMALKMLKDNKKYDIVAN